MLKRKPIQTSQATSIPKDWDKWVIKNANSAGFCQTEARAKIVQINKGAPSFVLTLSDNEEYICGALLSHFKQTSSLSKKSILYNLFSNTEGNGTLECFEGPVLNESCDLDSFSKFLELIESFAKKINVETVRFQNLPVFATWRQNQEVYKLFESKGYKLNKWLTSIVNLDNEKLFNSFKRSVRKNIRKCINMDLSVHRCRTFDEFYQDFYTNVYGNERELNNKNHAYEWWHHNGQGDYHFFVIKNLQNDVLATLGTYRFNNITTEIASNRLGDALKKNLPVQDLLHWEIFKYHKSIGDKWFNLAGYSPEPATPKEEGIRRFKEKWGGEK